MSTILLSGKVGTLQEQRPHWTGEDARTRFLNKFTDRKLDWGTKQTSQSLFYRTDNFPKSDIVFHRNYLTYLQRCWADHLGAVFTPDILWNSLLCELATIVKESPETYRHLFTDSAEKKEIIVLTGDPVLLPLSEIISKLRHLVPTDAGRFLPEFSTSTMRSKHAFHANFADMCSPYYNYSMYACNIPLVDVRGDDADYARVISCWDHLTSLFPAQVAYMTKVGALLQRLFDNLKDPSFWQQMFTLERCGSGGEVVANGWWTDIYRQQPSLRKPENFSSHIAQVSYKNLDDEKNYVMYDGLFFSKLEGDLLVPNFGFAVYEKTKPIITTEEQQIMLEVVTQTIKKP